ncbi:MAG: hypothetical protein Q4D16_19715 [Eubacteriales bacterium]|nr:hypothetical protein [Eubacteriales bacterium]
MENKEEKHVWIIRFADGTLASCYGTKEKAVECAEKAKDLFEGGFTIIK